MALKAKIADLEAFVNSVINNKIKNDAKKLTDHYDEQYQELYNRFVHVLSNLGMEDPSNLVENNDPKLIAEIILTHMAQSREVKNLLHYDEVLVRAEQYGELWGKFKTLFDLLEVPPSDSDFDLPAEDLVFLLQKSMAESRWGQNLAKAEEFEKLKIESDKNLLRIEELIALERDAHIGKHKIELELIDRNDQLTNLEGQRDALERELELLKGRVVELETKLEETEHDKESMLSAKIINLEMKIATLTNVNTELESGKKFAEDECIE